MKNPDLTIPVVFLIDVEPDSFFIDRTQRLPWLGYEKAFEYFKAVRMRIQEATGSPARLSWGFRMDPQILETYGSLEWPLTRYSEYFKHFLEQEDALGLHLHAYRWDEARGDWVVDHGDPDWVERCIRMSVGAFERAAGKRCDFFRFGERWMSDRAMKILDELGVPCDLSMEPGFAAREAYHPERLFTGSIPDQTNVPEHPYRPSRDDFRREDPAKSSGIWEVPLTTALLKPRLKFWLKPFREAANLYLSPSLAGRVIDHALEHQRGYLTLVMRTDVFLRKDYRRHMDATLAKILKHPLARRLAFVSPFKAVQIYNTQTH